MIKTHVLPIIFIYMPESLLTISITCALLGIKVNWKKIIPMGMLLGIEMYLTGYLTGNYILVMLIHFVFVVGGLKLLKVSELYESAICASIAFSIVLTLEFLCLSLWSLIIDMHPSLLMENPLLRIRLFAVQIIIALVINIMLKYYKLSIFGD